jgi:hypothetical protein
MQGRGFNGVHKPSFGVRERGGQVKNVSIQISHDWHYLLSTRQLFQHTKSREVADSRIHCDGAAC